jgi:hypothetical protein
LLLVWNIFLRICIFFTSKISSLRIIKHTKDGSADSCVSHYHPS